MIAYNIRINSLEKRTSHSDIVLTTGDVKGYKFKFVCEENESEISFMTLKAKRADGEVVVAGADTFEIVLPSDMYSIPGDIAFEVALHDADGGCVTVQVITAFVREGFGEDGIEGDDRYPILTTLINDVSGYKDVLEKLTDENGYLTDDAIADGSIGEEKIEKNLQGKINAQPDWNEQDESSAAYINNKPDIDGEIREVLAGQIDVGYMTINPKGRINTPAVYMTDGNGDWSGLIQYDEHGNEITMEQTLATKADKTNIVEGVDGLGVTLAHNTEYRIGEMPSTFAFAFDGFPTMIATDYISSVVFSTGSSAPVLTYPDVINWSGDDLTDGKFVPVANKYYTVVFWYDGMYLNGAVRGVEV